MIRGLNEAITATTNLAIRDFNYCSFGKVVNSDNLKDGYIDVQPLANYLDYSMNEIQYPVLYNVPVIFPNTGLTSITYPVNQGDGVLILFTERDSSTYLNGIREPHLPMRNSYLSLNHAVAFVGFSTVDSSCFNQNNYNNQLDMSDLNIVHNKKTDNEVVLSLKSDGNVKIKTNKTIYTESKEVNVKADTVNVNSALIKTENDVEIKGLSVYKNLTEHTHNYTDDGNPMVTQVPTTV